MNIPASETICFKIESIIKAIKEKTVDGNALVLELHRIRKQAQKMENGLRGRKGFMTKAGIEDAYQKHYKSTKLSQAEINGLTMDERLNKDQFDKLDFEITVKQNGEIKYQGHSKSGLLSIVEGETTWDNTGALIGKHQMFMYGDIKGIFFGWDMLSQALDERKQELLLEARKHYGSENLNKMVDKFGKEEDAFNTGIRK